MAYDFPYLKDSIFLKDFDEMKLKEQFVKITVLNFIDETPIQEIQGKVTGGSISFDGSSAMRRTGNINFIADEYENNLTTTKNLLSINKKVELLIGFKNNTNKYQNFDILWFPIGVYVIINPNISHGESGINISLTLHDKMALLNGECGGVLPASVTLSQVEDIDENGNIVITQPTIYQIIQELVNHFGGEQLGKIIISDIDNQIKQVMKWTGSTPLYLSRYWSTQDGAFINHFTTNFEEAKELVEEDKIREFTYGEDIGYILTDFVYPGNLVSNAGDSVVTILDQIKSVLGNYEYFYDVNGNFRFQEIKNYLNTSYATFEINEMNLNNYLVDYTSGKSVYNFQDANIVMSYSNSPQFQQIKNDFLVWGKRKTITGSEIPIRYHLTIDKKPQIGNQYKVFFFVDPDDGLTKAKKPVIVDSLPEKGEEGIYYYAEDHEQIFKWDAKKAYFEQTDYTLESVTSTDYRTQLYLAGVASQPFGLDSNYYYTELNNEWPKIYDIRGETPGFKEEVLKNPSEIDFFLDFIDTPAALSEFSVSNIGRRTTVLVDDSINCLFQPTYPDIVLIETNREDTDDLREECQLKGQEYSQVRTEIYSLLMAGGSLKSAYEEIRKELYQYTNYNEQVSLTTLPIYYLEPNTRITIRNNESGIYGDYMINTISLPLDSNGTMSITCTKAFERI